LPGAQVVGERGSVVADHRLPGPEAIALLSNIRSQQLGEHTFVNAVELDETDAGFEVTLRSDHRLRTNLVMRQVMAGVLGRLAARPDAEVHLLNIRPPSRRILVRVDDVPGFGWRLVGDVVAPRHAVAAVGERGLSNGPVTVEVDAATGTFSGSGLGGFGRLVGGGGAGDTYNCSPPDDDVEVDAPEAVDVRVLDVGPVRGRLEVTRRYRWQERDVDVTTTVELRAGEHAVRVTT